MTWKVNEVAFSLTAKLAIGVQCFSADNPYSTKDLTSKQVGKITDDIGKLLQNKERLTRILGTTKLRIWTLYVPRHDSARLLEHARKQEELARSWKLPFIEPDFTIFFGWDMPLVQTYDGKERPLYAQYLWNFLFVEQKRGWTEVTGRVPTHLQLREGYQRAFEFILQMDTIRFGVERQKLERIRSVARNTYVQSLGARNVVG